MASWATIARKAEPEKAAAPAPQAEQDGVHPLVAVVDANAIIAGQRLESLGAKRIVTITEVLAECRDSQSRAYLSSLPFTIETVEPSEDSVKAILRFARETGDIQVLSSTDVKLLALSHMMEVAAHGSAHLREHPVQARVRSKQNRKSNRRLQGWGTVPNPDEWKAIDEMEDQEAPEGVSRIIGAVSTLDLDSHPSGAQPAPAALTLSFGASPVVEPPAAATAATAGPVEGAAASAATPHEGANADPFERPVATAAGLEGIGAAPPSADLMDEGNSGDDDDEADDGWQTGGKSRGAVRKQRRKQRRHAAWVAAHQGDAAAPAAQPSAQEAAQTSQPTPQAAAVGATSSVPRSTAEQAGSVAAAGASKVSVLEQQQQQASVHSTAAASPPGAPLASVSGAAAGIAHEGGDEGEEDDSEEDQGSEGSEMDDDEDSGSSMDDDEDEGESSDDDETETTGDASTVTGTVDDLSVAGPSSTAGPGSTVGGWPEAEHLPNTTSSVMCVTGDFAMQNVVLQMGLRLVTHDGLQVTKLSVWSLRCTACSAVSKEMGRLFCPRCGNMTMERVEVTVGPGGAEYFGVRKKHVLRGTRYALPKPKGGRSNGPILCEDVMMMRMGKKLRRMQRLQQQQQGVGAGAAGSGTVDAFAPEFGPDTWFKAQHTASDKGALALMAGWKHNPNERKGTRTNRRK